MLVLASSHCPHGQWSSGRCRACPVGQVWITGTGCVAATDTRRCSSGNTWFEAHRGCRPTTCAHGRTSTGHCRPACPSGQTYLSAYSGCRPTTCSYGRTSTGYCRSAPSCRSGDHPTVSHWHPTGNGNRTCQIHTTTKTCGTWWPGPGHSFRQLGTCPTAPPTTTPPPPPTTTPPPSCRSGDHPTVSHWHSTGEGHRGCDTHTTTKTCGTWGPGPGHQARQLGTCPSTTPVTSCTSSYVFLSRYNGCRPEKCEYDRTSNGYCQPCPAGQIISIEFRGCRPRDCPTLWRTINGFCSPVCTDDQVLNRTRDHCLNRDPEVFIVDDVSEYLVTRGAYEGTIMAAREALDGYSSDCTTRQYGALTLTRLVAIMLAIPVHEITDSKPAGMTIGEPPRPASPMTLSRWDGWDKHDGKHNELYSHGTYEGQKRAHWNPGVGLWQIDEFTKELNHAERADTAIGGLLMARHVREEFCKGTTKFKESLKATWNGCNPDTDPAIPEGDLRKDPDRCYATYLDIYVPATNSNPETLNVTTMPGSDIDGGVQDRSCRWGPTGEIFDCYLYNVEEDAGFRQGWLHDEDPYGEGGRTPLAAPFISFTDPDTDIMYAVFPRSTALYGIHDWTIIKAVPKGTNPRYSTLGPKSDGWYNNTVNGKALYVNCRVSDLRPLGSLCIWENTNDE